METLSELIKRYPLLTSCESEINQAAKMLIKTFENGNRLYICGNGGSAAANTGSGGGGAGRDASVGGSGSAGLVIIRNHR